jgi:hypothetical protein
MKTATAPTTMISKLFRHGQMVVDPRSSGKPKIMRAPKPTHGAVRQTTGSLAPFHHGVTLDDRPNSKIIKSHEKPVAITPGMSPDVFNPHHAGRASHEEGLGQKVLEEAGNLGHPTKKDWS